MSSNGRWRRIKIVDISGQNRWNEIIGGLKNALERGETLEKAKRSFINAGYKLEEVEMAVQRIPSISSKISKPLSEVTQEPSVAGSVENPVLEKKKKGKKIKVKKEKPVKTGPKASKNLVIALIILGVLVLGGAVYMALSWETLF